MPHAQRTKVFISYSHHDVEWLERLQVHLKPLEREGVVERWDDTKIKPGANWRDEIKQALGSAKVAVLLVSADFMASDFIAKDELPPLLKAAEQDGAVILPVIVSPSRYAKDPNLSQFQAVNSPDRSLIALSKAAQEQVLVQLTNAIEDALNLEISLDIGRHSTTPETVPSPHKRSGAGRQSIEYPEDDLSPRSGQEFSNRGTTTHHRSLATWIFGSLLFAFIIGIFIFAPNELPEFKHRLLGFLAALLAGFFAYFLTGEIRIESRETKSRFGDMVLRASGGLAMFVVVLIWWLSPMAPVAQLMDSIEPRGNQTQMQSLSGSVRDEVGDPLLGVQVALPEFGATVITNKLGFFSLQVEAPYQARVELMAKKEGYQTHEQYATLGNTRLNFTLRRRK